MKSRGGGGGVLEGFVFTFWCISSIFFSDEKKKKILKFLGQDKGETREGLGAINAAIM